MENSSEVSTENVESHSHSNPNGSEPNGSVARFLYTQNPFYLVSCGFVLYGLLMAASTLSDQFTRASFLSSSLASYTALMALTAVAVVRWGKIWEDARTILLVVVISIVAYSIAVDELCVANPSQAAVFLAAGAVGAFLISEIVLRMCRIRFNGWYRAAYYSILGVYFGAPYVAGLLRASNHALTNWSPLLFSVAIGGAFLILIPAVRAGEAMARNNGTPWKWPLYPLSLFAILMVLAGFRSHAFWMSFGSLRGDVVFEPLLLLPLALAVLVLYVEAALSANRVRVLKYVTWISAALLLCGASSFATRARAFDQALSSYGGSAMTVTLAMLSVFYFYLWVRRVPGVRHAMPLCVWGIGLFGRTPEVLTGSGVDTWWCAAVACVLYFVLCQLERNTEWIWFAFTCLTAATIFQVALKQDQPMIGWVGAGVWLTLMFMFLGAIFDSWLANELRRIAGLALVMSAVASLVWVMINSPPIQTAIALSMMPVLCAVYLVIVKRTSWIYVTGVSAICTAIAVGHLASIHLGLNALDSGHWPLKVGFVFFCVGVVITSAKTGIYRRKWDDLQRALGENRTESGWGLQPGF